MNPTLILTLILGYYGNAVPDVQPAFSNYYQDIALGNNGFDNLTRIDGTYQPDRLDEFTFVWIFQGQEYEMQDLTFNQVEWSCDGVMEVTLRAIHNETGATFERTQTAFAEWSDTDLYPSPCLEGVCQFCVDPIWTPYEPYQYQTELAVWDCNGDNVANTADILCVLPQTGGQLQPSPPDPFEGFVPFKLVICGQTFYSATPEMIGVMKSHIGDYIPPMDMSGDGWIGAIDVIMLLTHQQNVVWFPNTGCINTTGQPFVYDWQNCGCMPNPGGCGSQSYCPSFMSWTDYGLIGELTTTTYGANNFTFYFAK